MVDGAYTTSRTFIMSASLAVENVYIYVVPSYLQCSLKYSNAEKRILIKSFILPMAEFTLACEIVLPCDAVKMC